MASQDPYRIALADDHPLFRQGIKKILEGKGNLEVVAEAGDGVELLLLLNQAHPSLVIVDISMPHLQGIDTLRQIRMKYPGMKILMLTMHREREYLTAALWAGADGYLLKDDLAEDLFSAIDTIREGKGFISPCLLTELRENGKMIPHFLKYIMDVWSFARILRIAPLKDPGQVEKMEMAGLAIKPPVMKQYAKYYMDLHERYKQLVEAARKAR